MLLVSSDDDSRSFVELQALEVYEKVKEKL